MSLNSGASRVQRPHEILRQRRRMLGLTQKELATRANLSKSALQKIELGLLRPSAPVLRVLARELQIDPAEVASLIEAAIQVADPQASYAARAGEAQRPPFYFGNLPFHSKPLIGRDAALRQIAALLARPQTRLITLVGPPGVGKSHMAVACAAELIGIPRAGKDGPQADIAFTGGAYLVELAEIQSVSGILAAIGRAVSLKPGQSADIQSLSAALRDMKCVLILDNFEHLIEGATLVSELLARTIEPRILVTSQTLLGLTVEQAYAVSQLPLPEATAKLNNWYDIHKYGSLVLFEQVVRRHSPDFKLSGNNSAVISSIVMLCNRVSGLPLAIELIASEWHADAPEAILEQLNRKDFVVSLASGRMRDLPEKQRSLMAALSWSQSLLSPVAQRAFHALSAFAGSFDADVASALGVSRKSLDDLERRNLLRSFEVEDSARGSKLHHRWSMLPVIREFAESEAAKAGRELDLRPALAAYYVAALRDRKSALRALHAQDEFVYTRTKLDRPNIVALIEWGCTAPENLLAVFELLVEYTWLVYVFGDINASYALLLRAIQRCRAWLRVDDAPFIERGYSELLKSLTWCMLLNRSSLLQWVAETGEVMASAATDLAHEHNVDEELQRRFVLWMWLDIHQQHEQAAAQTVLIEAMPIDTLGTAAQIVLHSFYNNRANSERVNGNYSRAITLARKALELQVARPAEVCITWQNIARSQHALGELDNARHSYAAAFAALGGTQDRYALMYLLDGAACLAGSIGAYDHAVILLGAADAIREEMLVDIPDANRVNYAAVLADTRSALGDDEFNAQMKLARELPIPDVICQLRTFLDASSGYSPARHS